MNVNPYFANIKWAAEGYESESARTEFLGAGLPDC